MMSSKGVVTLCVVLFIFFFLLCYKEHKETQGRNDYGDRCIQKGGVPFVVITESTWFGRCFNPDAIIELSDDQEAQDE